MAKKKSKTQKQKKNLKKKINKLKEQQKENVKKNIDEKKQVSKESKKDELLNKIKKINSKKKSSIKEQKEPPKRTIVARDQVKYKVFEKENKKTESKIDLLHSIFGVSETKIEKKVTKKSNKVLTNNKVSKKAPLKKYEDDEIEIPKLKKKEKNPPKNKFLRYLYDFYNHSFIVFDLILIFTFIILLIGMIRVDVFSKSLIAYIMCIIGFLSIIALSYNKYISGKVFTIFLTIIMIGGIYYLQYTYDFIRGLNVFSYEYREYYVVAFDNGLTRSVYSVNNKKVALLEENALNVERVLNTELDGIKYYTFDNQEEMFEDFYNNKFKALIVTENQYKYLNNSKSKPNQKVKVLYNFKVTAKKKSN